MVLHQGRSADTCSAHTADVCWKIFREGNAATRLRHSDGPRWLPITRITVCHSCMALSDPRAPILKNWTTCNLTIHTTQPPPCAEKASSSRFLLKGYLFNSLSLSELSWMRPAVLKRQAKWTSKPSLKTSTWGKLVPEIKYGAASCIWGYRQPFISCLQTQHLAQHRYN